MNAWIDGLKITPEHRETLRAYLHECLSCGVPENLTPREVEAWAQEHDTGNLVAIVVGVRRRMECREDAGGGQWSPYGYTPDEHAHRRHVVNRYNRRHGLFSAGS